MVPEAEYEETEQEDFLPEDTQDGELAHALFPPSQPARYPDDLLPEHG